jgi:hypothetical protein
MTTFNIRKLKIKLSHKERELKSASPNSWNRIRLERKALQVALKIAMENRDEKRRTVRGLTA